jgi:hypothetical protein
MSVAIPIAAAIAGVAHPAELADQSRCFGRVSYSRTDSFEPDEVRFRSRQQSQNISILAIALNRSELPILVQAGAGSTDNANLSQSRAALVIGVLEEEGIDPARVRVALAIEDQIPPDGLLVFGLAECEGEPPHTVEP